MLCGIRLQEDGSNVSNGEGVESYSHEHPNDLEVEFRGGFGRDVAVAYHGDGLDGPIEGADVGVELGVELLLGHPGFVAEVFVSGSEEPETSEDVSQD